MKHRDVRDQVNLGGDGVRRGGPDSKKSDGLKEFIRYVCCLNLCKMSFKSYSMLLFSKCPEKKINFKQFNAWLKCNRSVALDCLSARLAIQRVISDCEIAVEKTQIVNICDFAFVNRV